MDQSFPKLTESFLIGQDILYSQFNDIEFYVEDTEQENFYFEILRRLFPNIKFEKIFPLDGKSNVVEYAEKNIGNNKKIYLVDLDFDEILRKIKKFPNLFYLKKYSIENYLLEINAIREIIIEQKPTIKIQEIINKFDCDVFFNECRDLFSKLICCYLLIQKYELGIKNVKLNAARFCDFNKTPSVIKADQLKAYQIQIKSKLNICHPVIDFKKELISFDLYFLKLSDALKNIPGKYLLNFLKHRIEHLFGLKQMNLESFTFRLAKKCELTELRFLIADIEKYFVRGGSIRS